MADELHRGYRVIPETNTGFSAINNNPSIAGAAITLATFVGTIPSQFNMMPWGAFWTYTNFSDARFLATGSSISNLLFPNAPDGSPTAQKLVEDLSVGQHSIGTLMAGSQSLILNMQGANTGIAYTMAFIGKAAERTRVYITWQHLSAVNTPDPNNFGSVGFDLSGGQTYGAAAIGFTNVSSSITAIGGGWYLCKMSVTNGIAYPASPQLYQVVVNLDNGSGTAAKSISYAGDGSSGVDIWWLNMLPTCVWNASWSLTFNDDFTSLSTIDVNNTQAVGYNWYTNGYWPNSAYTGTPWTSNPGIACPANALSISSPSVLEINNPGQNQQGFSSQIMTACPILPAGSSYIGKVFQPPMIWDTYFNYNSLVSFFSTNWLRAWPSVWSTGIEILINNLLTDYVEFDMFEAAGGVAPPPTDHENAGTLHAWSGGPGPGFTSHDYTNPYNQQFNPGEFHRVSAMWLPTSLTGVSYGIILSFFDGTYVAASDTAYSSSTIPQHDAKGGVTSVGDLYLGESQHYPIILDTGENTTSNPGSGWPFFIDWVRVYTP